MFQTHQIYTKYIPYQNVLLIFLYHLDHTEICVKVTLPLGGLLERGDGNGDTLSVHGSLMLILSGIYGGGVASLSTHLAGPRGVWFFRELSYASE